MISIYRDQLNGQGLFAGVGRVEGDRRLELLHQIEQWEKIHAKISSQ
ncbi:hypothetical protein NIES2107_47760 [Nostoc carneum NIES-2107]|nr:hypothetical protein NIES2107_47760 [Nostoc carneum NIES-2107]